MTETMKHFFTLMALLLTSVTFGQETCNNVFDYNDNNTIDIEDFLAILGLFADVDLDDDGTWDSLDNCLDLSACNYASELNEPCTYLPPGDCDCNGNVLDECGVCGGTGLAPGTCDCNGTLIDVIGECGGSCWVDEDADGICDDVDECVGEYDACDVCNGPGAIYECGCASIPDGGCDCYGNVMDAIGACGGTCLADEDADGVCDDVDDCVGEFDVCGVCNGPGPSEVLIEDINIVYDSVFLPLDEDWFVFPVSADTTFTFACEAFETCGDPFNYQGYYYATVLIGTQCWFAENLRSERYLNGDTIVANLGSIDWAETTEGACAVYGEGDITCNDLSPIGDSCDELWSLNEYGRLYNWYAMSDPRGLCPSGWHIPDYDEFWELMEHFGGIEVAGIALKAAYGYHEGGNGTNSSGFSALPGGMRSPNGENFMGSGQWGAWWSSTPILDNSYWWDVDSHVDAFRPWAFSGYDGAGLSVRCIQDTPVVLGCTDTSSCNYDELANTDDGSCEYESCLGCTQPTACNYNPDAIISDDAICEFSSCVIQGCIVEIACNYNPEATINDGSCDFLSCQGCTDTAACNYDTTATIEDGSCEYESCAPSIPSCGDPVSYQGYEYATVQIGDQCWFAENLRSSFYRNGSEIPNNLGQYQWESDGSGASANPGGTGDSVGTYGKLYNYHAVQNEQELCPTNWRVPMLGDWLTLADNFGGQSSSADALKSTSGWNPGMGGSNESGFNGLPAGYRSHLTGSYFGLYSGGYWWTSSSSNIDGSANYVLLNSGTGLGIDSWDFNVGMSVRCIQNTEE